MIYDYIRTLVNYGIKTGLIEEDDETFIINNLIAALKLDEYIDGEDLGLEVQDILDGIVAYAIENNFCNDTVSSKDNFDTYIISLLVDRPSNVITKFNELYSASPKYATDYFYNLACTSNYIRTARVAKDIKWKSDTKCGKLDITINLSKPEKDPKDIAAAKLLKSASYPKCLLCRENEGYIGRGNHPARGNIRLIPVMLDNEQFYIQYSPYVYYNEHCIVLSKNHTPMEINLHTFKSLLQFVEQFPHYFIGSNADLPIVGGSILTHNHFQGGNYKFAMNDAKVISKFSINGVEAAHLYWPLSVIRLYGNDINKLSDTALYILNKWINYEDIDADIIPYTNGVRHNTITPIARFNNGRYELDLVLRNNRTTDEYPLGIFHPHKEYHHIKKENIGLIEVMGLAVLPSRLKNEINEIKMAVKNNTPLDSTPTLLSHKEWVEDILGRNNITEENIDQVFENEIGNTFEEILENAGVFKMNDEGNKHFDKFINTLDK